MARMKLDAVSVTSRDFAGTVQFYELLGFSFPAFKPDAKHLEAITPEREVRLMIDDTELIKGIIGKQPVASTHSSFAIRCETAADVDAAVAAIRHAGFIVVKEAWDAFWGQRYAVVVDPDGNGVDLFAALPKT